MNNKFEQHCVWDFATRYQKDVLNDYDKKGKINSIYCAIKLALEDCGWDYERALEIVIGHGKR